MSDDKSPSFAVMVDTTALREFRDTLFLHCAPTEEIPLRVFGSEGGLSMAGVAKVGGPLEPIVEMAMAAAASTDGGTFCPPIMTSRRGWRATESDIESAPVATVEIDHSPKRGRATIVQLLGVPTATIWSGGVTESGEPKVHLHYRLKRPARTREDILKLKRLRAMMALAAGGDRTSITPVHPLRWPGSVWRKTSDAKAVKMELNKHVEIDLDAAIAMMIEAGHDAPVELDRTPAQANLMAPSAAALQAVMKGVPNDPDTEWERWNTVGMALFNASAGKDVGLALFDEWSERSGRYDPKTTHLRWEHWRKSPADRIGFEHLKAMSTTAFVPGIEEVRRKLGKGEYARGAEVLAELESESAAAAILEPDEKPEPSEADRVQVTLLAELMYDVFPGKASLDYWSRWASGEYREGTPVWQALRRGPLDKDSKMPRFGMGRDLRVAIEAAVGGKIKDRPNEAEVAEDAEKAHAAAMEASAPERLARAKADAEEDRRFRPIEGGDEIIERMPDGAMRIMTETALAGMTMESQELAFMAALMAVSAISSNHFAVKSGRMLTALNCYSVGLAPSGAGKNSVQGMISLFMGVAGMTDRVLEEMPSRQGVHRALLIEMARPDCSSDGTGTRKSPMALYLMDEVSKLTKALVTGRDQLANETKDLLLLLFSRAAGERYVLPPAIKSNVKDIKEAVPNPFVTFGGLSTLVDYGPTMTEEVLSGGYGNRVLHFIGHDDLEAKEPEDAPLDPFVKTVLTAVRAGGHFPMGAERAEGSCGAPMDLEGHRIQRWLLLDPETRKSLKEEEAALRKEFESAGWPGMMANRFAEQVTKIAGLMSMLDLVAQGLILQEGKRIPWGDLSHDVRHDHVAFARWLVARQIRGFCAWIFDGLQIDPDRGKAEKMKRLMLRFLSDPEARCGKQEKSRRAIPHLKRGLIPSYLVGSRMSSGLAYETHRLVQTLIEAGDIEEHEETIKTGNGTEKTALYYRLVDWS